MCWLEARFTRFTQIWNWQVCISTDTNGSIQTRAGKHVDECMAAAILVIIHGAFTMLPSKCEYVCVEINACLVFSIHYFLNEKQIFFSNFSIRKNVETFNEFLLTFYPIYWNESVETIRFLKRAHRRVNPVSNWDIRLLYTILFLSHGMRTHLVFSLCSTVFCSIYECLRIHGNARPIVSQTVLAMRQTEMADTSNDIRHIQTAYSQPNTHTRCTVCTHTLSSSTSHLSTAIKYTTSSIYITNTRQPHIAYISNFPLAPIYWTCSLFNSSEKENGWRRANSVQHRSSCIGNTNGTIYFSTRNCFPRYIFTFYSSSTRAPI